MPCCFKKNPANSVNKQKKDYHLKCIGKLKKATNDIITIGGAFAYKIPDNTKENINRQLVKLAGEFSL
jgi:oligoribonuclease NrnB/cAMP/cGMP phosphodiesterase (DHH superfamily)